jgi:hypothetical protein
MTDAPRIQFSAMDFRKKRKENNEKMGKRRTEMGREGKARKRKSEQKEKGTQQTYMYESKDRIERETQWTARQDAAF